MYEGGAVASGSILFFAHSDSTYCNKWDAQVIDGLRVPGVKAVFNGETSIFSVRFAFSLILVFLFYFYRYDCFHNSMNSYMHGK